MHDRLRDAFDAARAALADAHHAGGGGVATTQAHADAVDAILARLFGDVVGEERDGLALVAVGGYGRRELAPYSDLDVLLVHRGWSEDALRDLTRAVLYPLWDAGRDVGNRVRDPRELVRSLERVDEAAAALDARVVVGDHRLFLDLEGAVLGSLRRSKARFFRDLVEASAERHARYGHAGHLLEPDLRDSAGGLRDIHTVRWADQILPGAAPYAGLTDAGYLSDQDRDTLERAHDELLRARVGLHLAAGRRQDKLYLDIQDDLAQGLGYDDDGEFAAADAMMRDVYRHAREVDAITSCTWERLTHRRRRFFGSRGGEVVGDGCTIQQGRLEVVAATSPRDDPGPWVRAFVRATELGVPMSRTATNRLAAEVASSGDLRWTPEARLAFLDLLRCGPPALPALEAMDAAGLLPALIGCWDGVRARPQRDLYHRYTLDMHLFAVATEVAASRTLDTPDVADAWERVPDDTPLLVAGLLHDVGKGRGGDHAEVGRRLAAEAAARMGLGASQVSDVEFLVREHLSLADLATRRDLNDARTIEEAASRARNERRLAMLYLLTRADALGTGPEAWSAYRASLVRELYTKTLASLEQGADAVVSERAFPDVTPPPEGSDDVALDVRPGDETDEVVVVARDRPGLFAVVSGALALRGADVHAAEIVTRPDGVAVEVYTVTGAYGRITADRWDDIRRTISDALAGRIDLDQAIAGKRDEVGDVPGGDVVVVIDNEASDTDTVVEVHTTDRLGLLRTITKTLFDSGCDLTMAKVATYGTQVVDVFYLRALDGSKITEPDVLERMAASLRSNLV